MHKWLTKNRVELCDGMVYGYDVSEYGLANGYLDYHTLARIVGDCVLNNNIVEHTGYENWEYVSGLDDDEGAEIYQYYIITDSGADFLMKYTDEIVWYNEELDMYVWGITHFGTSWDYVLTDMKLVK